MSEKNVLEVVNIDKSFAGVHALKGVSLSIKEGEVHCLAGENGSGKSTLIKVISGVYEPNDGHIQFAQHTYNKLTPIEAIRNGVQVIYQDFSIFPNLTVMENLSLNSELANRRKIVNKKRMRAIAEEAVAKIDFDVDLDAIVGELSVAKKQLIAISRALMFNAKLIIMDEPTTALTRKEVNALFHIIGKLKDEGIAILFVSHKLDEVFEICEKFTILRSGDMVFSGDKVELTNESFSFYMTGRQFEEKKFTPVQIEKKPVLHVKNLSLDGSFENISFSLRKGEILGITGILGSGRTELALSLFGIHKADSGTIYISDKQVEVNSPVVAMKNNIGYVPEDRLTEGLFLQQSIGDNIIVSELDNMTNRFGLLEHEKIDTEIEKWIDTLSIATPNIKNLCNTLSGGNQQRVVLAKWLARDLDILILNGPSVGVDIGSKYDIHEVLKDLAHNGLAVIIISDDIPEILSLSSRIIVLKEGRILKEMQAVDTNVAELTEFMM